MNLVRQVRQDDLDAVLALVKTAGHGLTSLPREPALLRSWLEEAWDAFRRCSEKPRGDPYLFVLEDQESGEVVGISGIVSKVGGFEPFYSYRLEKRLFQSAGLGVRKEVPCLRLIAEHSGPCEIGSLFLLPGHRRQGNGRLLSLARFLFMAEYPTRFDPLVIAEMRGVIDDDGRCPFWEAIGRHFFDVDFPEADRQTAKDKAIISELMPPEPIYVPLLTREAQEVLGRVHPRTEPALRLLQGEGFQDLGMVDLFDGGPVVGCKLGQIRTVRDSAVGVVREMNREPLGESRLVSVFGPEFRCCLAPVQVLDDAELALHQLGAEALRVGVGDRVRFANPRPGERRG